LIRSSTGEPGLFSGILGGPNRASKVMQFNAPNAHKPGPIPTRFSAPKTPEFRADKPFTRSLNRLAK
jgi:hypothetical protein